MSTPTSSTPPTVDQQVLDLFNSVRAKQRELAAAAEPPRWKTTCTIGRDPSSVRDRVNIQTVTDPAVLLDLFAFLLMQEDYWMKAQTRLESLRGFRFKWMGHTLAEWEADFRTRLGRIEQDNKRAELSRLEARLDKLITTDQRRALELAAIQAEMAAAQ